MEVEICERDKNDAMSNAGDFLPGDMYVDDLLTVSEKESVARQGRENFRALTEKSRAWTSHHSLYEGQSIL